VWSKDDAPPARSVPSDAVPAPWEGWVWGILPIGSSFLAILFVWLLVEPHRRAREPIMFPSETPESLYGSGVRS